MAAPSDVRPYVSPALAFGLRPSQGAQSRSDEVAPAGQSSTAHQTAEP